MSIPQTYNSAQFAAFRPISASRETTEIPLSLQEKAEELSKAALNYVPAIVDISGTATQCRITWNLQDSVSLSEYCERISARQCMHWVKQAVYALFRLHGMGILHGNISPDTVRITFSGDLLLAGIQFQYKSMGSEETDPEFDYLPSDKTYTQASDVYSLGKVFLYLVTGKAHLNIHKIEFQSISLYHLIRKMIVEDPEKRLQLKSLWEDFLPTEPEWGQLVETEAIPAPSVSEIRDLFEKLLEEDSDIPKKLHSDLDFMLRTNNPLSRLYERMIRLLNSLSKESQETDKLSKADQTEARKAGTNTLKSALLYQKTGLFPYAKYCYSRAILAYHLAEDLEIGGEEGRKHYWEVRSGKAVCYANLMELVERTD